MVLKSSEGLIACHFRGSIIKRSALFVGGAVVGLGNLMEESYVGGWSATNWIWN